MEKTSMTLLLLFLSAASEPDPMEKNRDTTVARNFAEDHASAGMSWTDDSKARLARKFAVAHAPETFLISTTGTIVRRWTGLALPAETAFAVENELSGRRE